MTRATLLHVLDHTTALGPTEVRELEQLAQAFPYCQTAHLLLAKAAHDQGTMLAGQRLRRAATYAADRTLLRRLIEQVAPDEATTTGTTATPEPIDLPVEEIISAGAVPVEAPTPALVPVEAAETAAVAPEPAVAATLSVSLTAAATPVAPAPAPPELPTETTVEPEAGRIAPAPTPVGAPGLEPLRLPPSEAEAAAAVLPNQQDCIISPARVLPQHGPAPEAAREPLPKSATIHSEPDLPAQAPAIRPSGEVGEARFEFGLAEPPLPALPITYELPGLVDEWAAAAVTRNLGGPAALETELPLAHRAALAATLRTPAAFVGDAAVGYGFGESSRLGFSLQLLNQLDTDPETAPTAIFQDSAAKPAAAPLPPVGVFFEPDPLLMTHWAAHCPPAPTLPSSLDLINNFLRRQPRLTRPAMLPPTPSTQPDLSVRSTRAEPNIASESLARILVRQGKTARAIEIYEKLMVKQPEKMAYFAAQIQQLQPPA